ncbi:S1 RNA-binding domain-containing protein [Bacillus aquiflavi]|uniref:S1 RNA-binding domain-containing protein n=1 Tax=Bacillus aquiflavi TaxID=2672567 RepID=UPI00292E0C6B|nr:S1 RNA-binding domain-containing protein [Bacillus aquiflavi]
MIKIVVNTVTREKRFAILKNNLIEKVVIHQPKLQSKVGNIYLGIVTKILPGMNAAFVDIGEDIKGFLHRNKLPSYLLSEEDAEIKQKKTSDLGVYSSRRKATCTSGKRCNRYKRPASNWNY